MQTGFTSTEFEPLFDATFFKELARKKIEDWKLDDSPRPIHASYQSTKFTVKSLKLSFNYTSFNLPKREQSGPYESFIRGILYLYNTKEAYEAADLNDIYNKQFDLNKAEMKNLAMMDSFEFKDMDRKSMRYFALVMFADLKSYIFKSKFLMITPEPAGVLKGLKERTDIPADAYVDDPGYEFKEIGTHAKNAGFFFMNQGKILPEASHSIHETNFGFFDSYPDKNVLNSQLFFYLKLLKLMAKKDANILILKDFLAKRAPSIAKCKNSLVVHARLEEMEFKHKDVSQTKESVFNLKELMDEKELSAQAVDLNIKLMRWRQLDTLDLELLHSVKVLLLGAGTLGCQLARNLIGWGVKHITFVDYGKVSHSNPVRQSLYNFEDVINGGKPKAETAAEALLKIQPTMTTAGYSFMIPMPGHSVRQDEQEKMFENLDLLDKLVSEHDAVMLLLDTREARWLPTVIASAHNKICFSVALGFDNFIIIRHGASPINYDETISGKRPGCYFCNDYLSPSNTMKDRSLDQQCTVTRPGLSFISSAYASELLVNMLHLKKEHIEKELKGEPLSNEFGLVPQHVRGTASGFNVDLMTSEAYDNCLACGAKIVNEYKRDKRALILKAVNDPNYLQEVSGIKEDLQIGGEGMGEIVCIDDLL